MIKLCRDCQQPVKREKSELCRACSIKRQKKLLHSLFMAKGDGKAKVKFITPVPFAPLKGDLVVVSLEQLVKAQKTIEEIANKVIKSQSRTNQEKRK